VSSGPGTLPFRPSTPRRPVRLHRDGPTFGLASARRAEIRPRRADAGHHVGLRDRYSKSSKPSSSVCEGVFAPTTSAAVSFGLGALRPLREDGDLDVAPDAVRHRDFPRSCSSGGHVPSHGAHVNLRDRLVDLGVGELRTSHNDRLGRRYYAAARVDLRAVRRSYRCRASSADSTPIRAAVPAMIWEAWSRRALEVPSLRSGDLAQLGLGLCYRPTLDGAFGLARIPLLILARWISTSGGGRRPLVRSERRSSSTVITNP